MYRKSYSRSNNRKSSWADAVPHVNGAQAAALNQIALMLFEKLGITNLRSYFEKLLVPIVLSVVVFAGIGAYRDGFSGFLWWGVTGLVAPAAGIWLAAVLPFILAYLALFFAAWFFLFYAAMFIFSL